MDRLRLRQLDSVAQLRHIAPAWDRLWLRSAVTLPTARAELVAQWIEHFAPHAPLRVLVVEQDGELVAALPLAGQRRARVVPVGDVTWNYWSPNGELLLDPSADAESALDPLAEAICQTPWSLLWLELVPFEAPRWQTLIALLGRRGMAVDVRLHYRIGQVELGGDFQAYEASRSKNLRRSIRKDMQRLQRGGPVELNTLAEFTPETVEQRLRHAFQIEQQSWRRDRGQTVLGTPGILAFYQRQACQLAQWGALRLAFLEIAGKPIAFELGWTAKGVYHSFKVGFDEAYRSFGLGHLLRWRLIESLAAQHEVQVIDFQGPMTEALAGWSTRSYPVGRVLVGCRPFGRTLMAGYWAAAPILRRLRARKRQH